jgi:acyl carrier protein
MINEKIISKVHKYVYDNAFANKEKITNDVLIFKEGFLDSMGLVMLITFLEETFQIKASDSDMIEENFESINAISSYVERKSVQV